jgi:2'-5' RNA ligase
LDGPVPKDEPNKGALEFVKWLQDKGAKVVVFTTRAKTKEGKEATEKWLKQYNFPSLTVTNKKIPAHTYIDDRAVNFDGDWKEVKKEIQGLESESRLVLGKRGEVSTVMVTIPAPEELQNVQDQIADEDVYKPDDEQYGKETWPHVTVLYGIVSEDFDAVYLLLENEKSATISFDNKTSIFEQDEYDVVKIDVKSEELKKMNKMLWDEFEVKTDHPDFHPHLTIAYVKKGTGEKYNGLEVHLKPVKVSEMVFSNHNREKQTFLLRKPVESKLAFSSTPAELQAVGEKLLQWRSNKLPGGELFSGISMHDTYLPKILTSDEIQTLNSTPSGDYNLSDGLRVEIRRVDNVYNVRVFKYSKEKIAVGPELDELNRDIAQMLYRDHKYSPFKHPEALKVIVTKPLTVEDESGNPIQLEVGDRMLITVCWPDFYEGLTDDNVHVFGDYKEIDTNTEPFRSLKSGLAFGQTKVAMSLGLMQRLVQTIGENNIEGFSKAFQRWYDEGGKGMILGMWDDSYSPATPEIVEGIGVEEFARELIEDNQDAWKYMSKYMLLPGEEVKRPVIRKKVARMDVSASMLILR